MTLLQESFSGAELALENEFIRNFIALFLIMRY